MKRKKTVAEKYSASEPCGCDTCTGYCARPGWWTVDEAARAIAAGYGNRMMLEMAPDRSFGVLSPGFKGCEVSFALQVYADRGCTFLDRGRCELFGTDFRPLECRVCHHDRRGVGEKCHADIEREWNTQKGRDLVVRWSRLTGFWDRLQLDRFGSAGTEAMTGPQCHNVPETD
jgi:Fe-S-cluster containining protein